MLQQFCNSLRAKIPTVDGRNPAPVEVGSLSHSLQGLIHPRWRRISSMNGSILHRQKNPIL